jgi:hypothetical protein
MQDEQKKLMILAALGVVILGVGAFQLMPSDSPKPTGPQPSGWKPPVTSEKTEEKAAEPAPNPQVVAALPRRDPFDVPDYAMPPVPGTGTPITPAPLPAPRFSGRPPRSSRPPRRMTGRLGMGDFGRDVPSLPEAGFKVEPVRPTVDSNVAVTKTEPPKPPEPTFDYTLSGVIVGRRPAAVLRDKQGNQRLVAAGGMIDGEATLVEVRPGAVVVDVRGKRLRIELKGDTVEK